jgi:hypothetical protein
VGGIIVPFIGIKLIDLLLAAFNLRPTEPSLPPAHGARPHGFPPARADAAGHAAADLFAA